MLRILILGDHLLGHSGYSRVIYNTAMGLKDMGHIIAQVPTGRTQLMDRPIDHEGLTIYPSGQEAWSEDVVWDHYQTLGADLLITVKDIWIFQRIINMPMNFCPMVVVDHTPVSALITSKLNTAYKCITISRFGQRELASKGVDSFYIPHGVDRTIYKKLDKEKCKTLFEMDPDEYIVGIVALNRARKMIARMLRGFKAFKEANPSLKTRLFLWTDVRGQWPKPETGVSDVGVDLLPEIMELGLGDDVAFPDMKLVRHGIPEWAGDDYEKGWDMVKLYNSFDSLLLCSGGEGFGLPLIEAQACGVPVVTTDVAAGPEVVGSGLTVPAYDYVNIATPGHRWWLPDVKKMGEALTSVMKMDPDKVSERAVRFTERYEWRRIMENYWEPFLESAASELKPLYREGGVSTWA